MSRRGTSLLLGSSLFMAACGAYPQPEPPAHATPDPGAASRGRLVFETEGCGACHGDHLQGTELGPPLTGVATHWQQPGLEAFLKDPAPALSSDPRLIEIGRQFEVEMPGVSAASNPEVVDLAVYLLSSAESSPAGPKGR